VPSRVRRQDRRERLIESAQQLVELMRERFGFVDVDLVEGLCRVGRTFASWCIATNIAERR